jgi:hypothetical protein
MISFQLQRYLNIEGSFTRHAFRIDGSVHKFNTAVDIVDAMFLFHLHHVDANPIVIVIDVQGAPVVQDADVDNSALGMSDGVGDHF